jgi:hypothetical protein
MTKSSTRKAAAEKMRGTRRKTARKVGAGKAHKTDRKTASKAVAESVRVHIARPPLDLRNSLTMRKCQSQGTVELNRKAIDIARRNIDNGFGLAERLAGAKNLAEAMELQTTYWRKQVGELASQVGEMRTLTTRVTSERRSGRRSRIADDQRCVDGADRDADDPGRRHTRFDEAFIHASLVGPKRTTTL